MRNTEIAKRCFLAYVQSDHASVETLIAEDFSFTSPLDNSLDRETYFERCWPNHQAICDFKFVRLIENGDEVIVTYEGKSTAGKFFRNTEVLTMCNGKIKTVEVYFGWDIPHKAPLGGFVNEA